MRKYLVLFCIIAVVMIGLPTGGTNAMAKLDPAFINMGGLDQIHAESELLPVIIRLQKPCVVQQVTFGGSFTTSVQEINNPGNINRITALSSVLIDQQNSIKTLTESIDGLIVRNTYQLSTNSIRALVPRESINDIAELPCVSFVWYEAPQTLHRWHSRGPLNCWPVYDGESNLDGNICLDPEGREVNGKGIVCAVSDTGLDYTHQDFGSQSRPVGNKVIISHDFGTGDNDCQEEDGKTTHGTNCAGIIAADGPGQEKGIAPKAKLAGYKISGTSGAITGDISAAWEMMIKEEIDVSNNSWGRRGGYSSFREAENNAVLAGVSIVASQGNSGSPGPNVPIPCGSTSSPENVIAAGATMDYATFSKAIISDAPDMDSIGKEYKGIWGPTRKEFKDFGRPIQILDCGWGREQDFSGLDLDGKIALIWRGPGGGIGDEFGPGVFFSAKLNNAFSAGAITVLLYNHSPGFLSLGWGNYSANTTAAQQANFLPCLELLQSQGKEMRDMLHAGNDWKIGEVDKNQNDVFMKFTKPQGYANIANFTSQGPSAIASLKPDVCAPGSNIRTCVATSQDSGLYTNDYGGTSAAGPFVCGVVCLVRQARPEWNPFEVKRALMCTANLLRRYKDDSYIPVLSQGMGRPDAFNACTTDVLIQPPSSLIVAGNGYIKTDDSPEEWEDKAKKARLPSEVKKSMIAYKVYNYSTTNPHNIELSYEVNSRQADGIKVTFSSKSISIPMASEADEPSSAWVGIDVEWPVRLTGGTNDIIIWFTDKKTGQKWHTGVCIYNNSPSAQGINNTYSSFIEYTTLGSPPTLTPNGDGIDDGFYDIAFTQTNGSYNGMYGRQSYYDNYANGVSFMVKDYNEKTWQTIFSESVLELGEHEFSWDGLGDDGEYLLPDGEWYLGMSIIDNVGYNRSTRRVITGVNEITFFKKPFQVADSVVPPLPLVSAYPIPSTPGKGNEFELGIYIQHATNIKSIQFYIILPGLSDIAKFKGKRLGEFMLRNTTSTPFWDIDHEEGSDRIRVDIQRDFDGVSGEGWLAYIRLLPIASNYLDVTFENLNISYINEETMKEEYKFAFYKTTSITIEREFYNPADFNHDGRIDEDDLDILTSSLGSTRGEDRFNWRCDLDFNGIIDMNDMAIFAQALE